MLNKMRAMWNVQARLAMDVTALESHELEG